MEKNGKKGRVGEGGKRREGRGGKAEERKRGGKGYVMAVGGWTPLLKRGFQPFARNTRLTQATQGPNTRLAREIEQRSNLTQTISRDKFQPCHWPLLAFVAFLALRELRKAGNRA